MKLIIAEKPSLARTIAQNLPGTNTSPRGAGYIENDHGFIVTWCVGHIYELAPPGYYSGGKSTFNFNALPILPEVWKTLPKEEAKSQVRVIKDLLKKATSVINAGDPDREGQLIVDELLEANNCRLPVKRLWLHGMDEVTVKRALASLEDNNKYVPLGRSALARARADWLVGMNLSPAFTLAAQKGGFSGTISIGRVQTPTLSMIVTRDLEIERFVPKDFFVVSADIKVANGQFTGKFKTTKDTEGVDSEGRITSEKLAKEITARNQGVTGQITRYDTKRTTEYAPLSFSLSSLQVVASRKFGYGAKMVLDVCQALYEKHELTTYPRTDCEYLPENNHADAKATLQHLSNNFKEARKANPSLKGRIFNDKKVTAHFAITPTTKQANLALLSSAEKNIYELISMHYIAQFYPDYVYDKTNVEATFNGKDVFGASGRVDIQTGWRDVLTSQSKKNDDESSLPKMTLNEIAKAIKASYEAKKTTPPKHYTEGTLIEAMTNVHLVVTDPEIKKKLKEVAGIGTEATRASIIETLMKREFVRTEGKNLLSTPTGRGVIQAVPTSVKDPGMTALWESALGNIAEGRMTVDEFVGMQYSALNAIVDDARTLVINIPSGKSASKRGGGTSEAASAAAANTPCAKCGKPMRALKSKAGGKSFMGCSAYPACNHTVWPEDKKKSYGGANKGGFTNKHKSGEKGVRA